MRPPTPAKIAAMAVPEYQAEIIPWARKWQAERAELSVLPLPPWVPAGANATWVTLMASAAHEAAHALVGTLAGEQTIAVWIDAWGCGHWDIEGPLRNRSLVAGQLTEAQRVEVWNNLLATLAPYALTAEPPPAVSAGWWDRLADGERKPPYRGDDTDNAALAATYLALQPDDDGPTLERRAGPIFEAACANLRELAGRPAVAEAHAVLTATLAWWRLLEPQTLAHLLNLVPGLLGDAPIALPRPPASQ